MSKALLHELGKSISFGRLSLPAKVLWPMLLAASDDQGRGIAEPDVIKWHVCPNVVEIEIGNVPGLLGEMAEQDMIALYQDDRDRALYQIVNWEIYSPRIRVPARLRCKKMSRKLRKSILERDAYICQYCGGKAEHVDHVVPRCYGGSNNKSNLVAACQECNQRKSGRTPEQAGMRLRFRPVI